MAATKEYLFAPGQDWSDYGGVERSNHDPANANASESAGSMAVAATFVPVTEQAPAKTDAELMSKFARVGTPHSSHDYRGVQL